MGKKSGKNNRPNAPELQQMLLHAEVPNNITHPPHNPYYPDLSTAISRSQLPPPPYNDLSTPMTTTTSLPLGYIHHQRQAGDMPRPLTSGTTSVVINQPSYHDHRAAKHQRKVRRFNHEVFMISLLSAVLAICAYKQYDGRNCIRDFVVHKPNADLIITIDTVRAMHVPVFYISIVIMLLSLMKCMFGDCRNNSCYLFLIAIVSILGTILTGYLTWLAFYSPCGTNYFSNAVKTGLSKYLDSLPSPDKGFFGESTVLDQFREGRDIPGIVIFLMDAFNCILYVSLFLCSTLLCS